MSTAAPTPAPASRASIIQVAIRERGALYAAYIPLFKEGGLFVATDKPVKLGDDLMALVSLPEDPHRYPIAGKVAWITPARAAGNRTQGVGIRFPSDEKAAQIKSKIELILGSALHSEKPTLTI